MHHVRAIIKKSGSIPENLLADFQFQAFYEHLWQH